ncbi:MAG: CHAT domain-containing protein, partial [Gemmatimonadaceae bacterium]
DPANSVANVIAALAAHGRVGSALTLADQRRARTIVDALLRTSGGNAAQTALGTPAASGLEQRIQSALRDSTTAVVEYSAAARGTPMTLFVVTKHDSRAYVLPSPDSITRLAERLTVLMEAGMNASDPARQLGRLLLDRAISDLPAGVTHLAIVTDGSLQRIPFDVLRMEDDQMVIQRFATSRVPSASVLLALWQRPVSNRATSLLAFGDPIFDPAPTTRSGQPSAGDNRQAGLSDTMLPPLPGSRGEVNSISRFFTHSNVRLRGDASATFLERTALQSYSVIHFAAHAIVDEEDNSSTALVLSRGTGETGLVSPADLVRLHLDADMVVLSACRSARGVLIGGEGVQGLTTPLLEAGARSVVASRWKVGDQRTATFVVNFYTQLAHGLPVTDALRSAKLDAIQHGATPAEWAAFTVVGDPLVTLPLTLPASAWRSRTSAKVITEILLLAAALWLAMLTTRRYRTTRNRDGRERIASPPADVETHQE